MVMIKRLASLTILASLAAGLSACMHAEDPITQYTQRTDRITVSGGNALASNDAIQTIDPWPRASANRRLPTNAERMAGAYERYRDVSKQPPRPMIIPPSVMITGGGAPAGAGAAAAAR